MLFLLTLLLEKHIKEYQAKVRLKYDKEKICCTDLSFTIKVHYYKTISLKKKSKIIFDCNEKTTM